MEDDARSTSSHGSPEVIHALPEPVVARRDVVVPSRIVRKRIEGTLGVLLMARVRVSLERSQFHRLVKIGEVDRLFLRAPAETGDTHQ